MPSSIFNRFKRSPSSSSTATRTPENNTTTATHSPQDRDRSNSLSSDSSLPSSLTLRNSLSDTKLSFGAVGNIELDSSSTQVSSSSLKDSNSFNIGKDINKENQDIERLKDPNFPIHNDFDPNQHPQESSELSIISPRTPNNNTKGRDSSVLKEERETPESNRGRRISNSNTTLDSLRNKSRKALEALSPSKRVQEVIQGDSDKKERRLSLSSKIGRFSIDSRDRRLSVESRLSRPSVDLTDVSEDWQVPKNDKEGQSESVERLREREIEERGREKESRRGKRLETISTPKLQLSSPNKLKGTPKLVLTEEGSLTPRSVGDSPSFSPTSPVGLGWSQSEVYLDSPTTPHPLTFSSQPTSSTKIKMTPSLSTPVTPDILSLAPTMNRTDSSQSIKHLREGRSSTLSTGHNRSRSGSLVTRLSGKASPIIQPQLQNQNLHHNNNLQLPNNRRGSGSKKNKKDRRMSNASTNIPQSVAAALAKSGLHLANANNAHEELLSAKSQKGTGRSPYLTGRTEDDEDSELGSEYDDESEGLSEGVDEHLPVTGFAVASSRRNGEFHATFPKIDEGDYLIDDYGCALNKDILVQGRLFISENHISFHSNILGWTTNLVIAFLDIKRIEKKMTALVIPNAIGITTTEGKTYVFASFLSRDSVFDVMMNIWRLCNPSMTMSSISLHVAASPGGSIAGDTVETGQTEETEDIVLDKPKKGHAKTVCACGKEGRHYSEVALETTFPSSPEKIYNLMFTSEWYKGFLSDVEKLKDIETSDWRPKSPGDKNLTRSMSYIKPLNGSIGPKQTKCHIIDETEHLDFDDFVTMVTTTRTPDVPSGGVFSVKTRTCLMWAGAGSTRVVVSTCVEWTGKSWVKGIIEKSAIEGQKTYHSDLSQGMRQYISAHPTEFLVDGVDPSSSLSTDPDINQTQSKSHSPSSHNQLHSNSFEKGEIQKSEAEEYAARTRRERHEKDYAYLQGAFDSFLSGLGSLFSALYQGYQAVSDMLSDLLPSVWSKQGFLMIVIVLLVISNLYTYKGYKSVEKVEERRMRRENRNTEMELARAMRMILAGGGGRLGGLDGMGGTSEDDTSSGITGLDGRDDMGGEGGSISKRKGTVKEETEYLIKVLDNVESRVEKLRKELKSESLD
ncbi:hypothetical protein M231_07488 [Tremella mesenterica]|uniref:VASt domain-containing protein n=1 Tax=Tremella mesenterica TaxID=5217 RepID=A0A4Q1BFS3_TREME|nr:hypothetical protein M231_07488 [Tremella mesenterica]